MNSANETAEVYKAFEENTIKTMINLKAFNGLKLANKYLQDEERAA